MDIVTPTGTGRVDAWLAAEVGLVGQLSYEQIAGGRSNVTMLVTDDGGRRVVLRRPPGGSHAGGAHDVLREATIVSAFHRTGVPVPPVIGVCGDEDVLGVPFFVMEFVAGDVIDTPEQAERLAPADRGRLGFELIGVLSELQRVDLDEIGLASMRRSTPYLARQRRRWIQQWQHTKTRELTAIDHVGQRIDDILPRLESRPECFVHGDFRLGNTIVALASRSPHIAALLDWELATVGHPLADLGLLGARILAPAGVHQSGREPLAVAGYPTFDELTEHFAVLSGVSVVELPVFVAFHAWRWAIIVEGVYRRLANGLMGETDEDVGWHRQRAELLATFAADLMPLSAAGRRPDKGAKRRR